MIQLELIANLFEKIEGLPLDVMHNKQFCIKRKKYKCDFQFLNELEGVDVICIYGLDKRIYTHLEKWLSESNNRYLVFIEDDLAAFSEIDHTFLNDKKIKIHFLNSLEDIEKVMQKICWYFSFLQIKLYCHPFYERKKTITFDLIKKKFDLIKKGIFLVSSEFSDFGVHAFENTFRNLFTAKKVYAGNHLKDSFKNIPAIICGAGPSIEKHIELLKKCENKALIFAGGTTLNILSSHVMPHIGGAVDKQSPYESFKRHCGSLVPFFYQSRVSSKNFSLLHGDLFLFGDSNYSVLQKWLESVFKIKEFNGGWNVSSFLIHVASFLGCNPIIFIGQDLAYSKTQHYAKADGVVSDLKTDCHYMTLSTENKNIYTQLDWIMARNWIEDLAEKNKHQCFINATEGGLGFNSPVKTAPFQEVVDRFLKNNYDLDGMLHTTFLSIKPLYLENEKIMKELELLKSSLLKCKKIVEAFFNKCKTADCLMIVKESICSEQKIQKKAFYRHVIKPVWHVWAHILQRNIDEDGKNSFAALQRIVFFNKIMAIYEDLINRLLNDRQAV